MHAYATHGDESAQAQRRVGRLIPRKRVERYFDEDVITYDPPNSQAYDRFVAEYYRTLHAKQAQIAQKISRRNRKLENMKSQSAAVYKKKQQQVWQKSDKKTKLMSGSFDQEKIEKNKAGVAEDMKRGIYYHHDKTTTNKLPTTAKVQNQGDLEKTLINQQQTQDYGHVQPEMQQPPRQYYVQPGEGYYYQHPLPAGYAYAVPQGMAYPVDPYVNYLKVRQAQLNASRLYANEQQYFTMPPRYVNAPGEMYFTPNHPMLRSREPDDEKVSPPRILTKKIGLSPGTKVNRIQKQLEYYLSDHNLQKDDYLRQLFDKEGWIDARLFPRFNRMKQLEATEELIIEAAYHSHFIDVNGSKIRVKGDWQKYIELNKRNYPEVVRLPKEEDDDDDDEDEDEEEEEEVVTKEDIQEIVRQIEEKAKRAEEKKKQKRKEKFMADKEEIEKKTQERERRKKEKKEKVEAKESQTAEVEEKKSEEKGDEHVENA